MVAGSLFAGRFDLEAQVGAGGMACVYRARDHKTGVQVALKVLTAMSADGVERFSREAHALADLSHPAIVAYVGHGVSAAGENWLAMEWLEGEDLDTRIESGGPLTLTESISLVRRVAAALNMAHGRGVVHRDIKPANLYLVGGEIERVKVLDFGVARFDRAARKMTRTGATLGTPGYMAPEQVRGERDVDGRADLYSLGSVFFECLTGRPAFTGDNAMAVLVKILFEEAPRVSEIKSGLPDAVDRLVVRLLSKDRTARPADAAALQRELDALEAKAGKKAVTRRRPTLTSSELRVVCVVVAGTGEDPGERGSTIPMWSGDEAIERLRWIRETVADLGADVERLADGSVVAVLSGPGTPVERAVAAARCALVMRQALPQVPIVLATGRGIATARLPVGEVIDRAVQALADAPGHVVRLDDVTAPLLASRFQVEKAGTPGGGWYLLGERHDVLDTRTLLGKPSPCVGRDRELAVLDGAFDACLGEAASCAVVLTAPPGVGKSRLAHAFVERLRRRVTGIEVLRGQGDALSAESAFGMIAPAIRRAAGILEGEPAELKRQKLKHMVGRSLFGDARDRTTEFLGELVGVPFPDDSSPELRAARANAQLMGDRMRAAWEEWLASLCATRPVVLVLEDLHYGDLPTVQLVDTALRTLRGSRLMVLAMARPEVHERFGRLWPDRDVTEVRLRGLSRQAAESMVRRALGDMTSIQVVDSIVNRAEGNAFYLEELIRAVSEGGGERMPETVLGTVQARLDALDKQARRVLRAASVFGQTFWSGGVAALVGAEQHALTVREWLVDLETRELVEQRKGAVFPGEAEYVFRNDLVREAAYATLTDRDRVLGHRLAGSWLERMGEHDPVVLAGHFERGGETQAAARWYERAASEALAATDLERALSRADRGLTCGADSETAAALHLVKAEAYLWKVQLAESERCALEAVAILAAGTERWYMAVGQLLIASAWLGHSERVLDWIDRLRASPPESMERVLPHVAALCRVAAFLVIDSRYELADKVLHHARHIAGTLIETDALVSALYRRVEAFKSLHTGDLGAAVKELEAAAESFAEVGDLRNAWMERVNLSYFHVCLGQFSRAESMLREALVTTERMGLTSVHAIAGHNLGYALTRLGAFAEAKTFEQRAVDWFTERGDARFAGASRGYLSEILARTGDLPGAEREARAAIEILKPFPPLRAQALARLALVRLAAGHRAPALEAAREGMVLLSAVEGIEEAESLLRMSYVEALWATDHKDEARAELREAAARLRERAARIADPALRKSFLEKVPENARTLFLQERWGASVGSVRHS